MIEIWKDIPGYEGLYQVSNIGNVKSLITNKVLKLFKNSDGYKVFTIHKDKIKKQKRVHRFMAICFILNPENKPHINHINGVKSDNRLENLEWCTPSENARHAYRIGLAKQPGGEHNYNAKHTKAQAEMVRSMRGKMSRLTKISKELNVNLQFVKDVLYKNSYK